jgi:hypothetical protein
MAPLRHASCRLACLLSGEDRKRAAHGQNDANDPKRTCCPYQGTAFAGTMFVRSVVPLPRLEVWDQIGLLRASFSILKGRKKMLRKLLLAAFVATFASGAAFAQERQESCETKAVGKDGKPLAGAAKTSFMRKCMADSCANKAVSAEGKPLSGAAKTSFIRRCRFNEYGRILGQ